MKNILILELNTTIMENYLILGENLHNINSNFVQISTTTKQHTLIEPHLMPHIRGFGQRVGEKFLLLPVLNRMYIVY